MREATAIRIPADDALPQLARLLDVDAVRQAIAPMLADDRGIAGIRVTYIRYRPRKRVLVGYEVTCGPETFVLVAQASADRSLAARVARRESVALAEVALTRRSPARRPLAYDDGLSALFEWPPFDLALPALVRTPEDLRMQMEHAGLRFASAGDVPLLIKHNHAHRAVLSSERYIAKVYRNERALSNALAALRAAAELPVRTAACEASLPELRMAVQSLLPGRRPESAEAAAASAGALLAELHAGRVDGLPVETPADRLERTRDSADLISSIAPELAERTQRLIRRLEDSAPEEALVTSHGGFHVSQLLETDSGLAVIDFDGACLAPAARDLASYVASVADGPDRLAHAGATMATLCGGYGSRPGGVAWYLSTLLLRRARAPFAAFHARRPEEMEQRLETAERALDEL